MATNRNLPERVAAGQFRADLYERLKGLQIRLPSLAERDRADIDLLVRKFERVFGAERRDKEMQSRVRLQLAARPLASVPRSGDSDDDDQSLVGWMPAVLHKEVIEAMRRDPWPGNVRELRTVVRRLVYAGSGEIRLDVARRVFKDVTDRDLPGIATTHDIDVRAVVRGLLNKRGVDLFEELVKEMKARRMTDPDPEHVIRLLAYLASDSSRSIKIRDSRSILNIGDTQFSKVVAVLFQSEAASFNKHFCGAQMLTKIAPGEYCFSADLRRQ